MRTIRVRRKLVVATAFTLMVLLLITALPQAALALTLPQAIGYYSVNPYGNRAYIETADPQIRDGGFSWVRATVQYSSGGANYFAEIGWMKYPAQCPNQPICVYLTSRDPTYGYYSLATGYNPGVGGTHPYTLRWNSSANGYDTYYDTLYVDTRPASYTLTRVFCGGEASTDANAIGISGCLKNQYATSGSVG